MKKLISIIILIVLLSIGITAQADTPIPPSTSDPSSSFPPQINGTPESRPASPAILNYGSADILLIQTNDPWENPTYFVGDNWYDGITSDTEVLDELEYSYHIADWDAISSGQVDIFSYPVILIVNDQIQEFYDDYAAHVTEFEDYVRSGRTLVFFAAGYGWAGGELNANLPGGVVWNGGGDLAYYNVIVNNSHPIVTAELSNGIPLINDDLYSNWCSHGWFSALPSGTQVILQESDSEGGEPTLIEYSMGNGKVIASTLTWEHSWHMHTGGDSYGTFARKALDDVFLYAFSGGITPSDEINMSLHIDDAPAGVVVNKVAGDSNGPAENTFVDIVAVVKTRDENLKNNVSVVLTIQSNILGTPSETFIRTLSRGTDSQSINYEVVSPGQYKLTADLTMAGFFDYTKQFVWRFVVPDDSQEIELVAELQPPNITLADPFADATLNIIDFAETLIIANRTKLYEEYDYRGADQLLQQVYTIAQGPPRNSSPMPVVYYIDRYSNVARDWDQNNVDYSGNEAQANAVATVIDGLIEDWFDDGDLVPFLHPYPDYLLIIGDDNVIPFYRYDDPTNGEGINLRDCNHDPLKIREHPGWCEDSNENPVIHATDEDYFFTDNPYADHGGGTDWQEGNLEMAVGRIVGDSIEGMLGFLTNGVNDSFHNTGGVVMASVDGWELGLEPHTGNKQVDLHSVPNLFTNRGFVVRNDDDPTSEVRTIDIITPDVGENTWNTSFVNAANEPTGMDLFFIGGHDDYHTAYIPGSNDFTPDDTPNRYTRFGTDHPIAMITGCHGGLAVPDIHVDGGVEHDMVYDLIHEGASAYIGATGFSLGSPNDLHDANWGEALIQRFFGEFLTPTQTQSQTIGKAMQRAKINYQCRDGNNGDLKTVTEFVVYGVPWQYIHYPNNNQAQILDQANQRGDHPQELNIEQSVNNTFTLNFTFDISDYSIIDDGEYEIISIDDGKMNYKNRYPILPFLEGITLPLPDDISITDISVVNSFSTTIGTYNIPIIIVNPFSEGGITYTNETDIDYFYPSNLIFSDKDTNGLTFYVYPFQHNPTTDETILHSHIEVQVTYETPVGIATPYMSVVKPSFTPGDTIQSEVTIANIRADDAYLTTTLKIINPMGEIVVIHTSDMISIPSGESYIQSADISGNLAEGAYRAFWEIQDDSGVVGGISEYFNVLGGEITDFAVQDEVIGYANFNLAFSNHKSEPIEVEEEIFIYDSVGTQVAKLPKKTVFVDANQNISTNFSWDTSEYPRDTYTAVAFARVGDIEYGPAIVPFDAIVNLVFVPLVLKNYSTPIVGFDSQFNGDATSWNPQAGGWSVDSNYYNTPGIADAFASTSYITDYDNFDYQVHLKRDGCDACSHGVIVRGTPTPFGAGNRWNSGYGFYITQNGYFTIQKYTGGSGTSLQAWTPSSAINTGDSWNTLRVVASGENLYFYINSSLVWSGTDTSYTTGKVGILMYRSVDSTGDLLWVDWAKLDIWGAAAALPQEVIATIQQELNNLSNKNGITDDRRAP